MKTLVTITMAREILMAHLIQSKVKIDMNRNRIESFAVNSVSA